METVVGTICALNPEYATVCVDAPVACQRCAAGKGCGAGLFQSSGQRREIQVVVPAHMTLQNGDTITLRIDSKFLLRAALLAYGLPLAGLVLFPALAWLAAGRPDDLAAVLYAVLGLGTGFALGRRIMANGSICRQFVPEACAAPDA